jgi:hypothetical protein
MLLSLVETHPSLLARLLELLVPEWWFLVLLLGLLECCNCVGRGL